MNVNVHVNAKLNAKVKANVWNANANVKVKVDVKISFRSEDQSFSKFDGDSESVVRSDVTCPEGGSPAFLTQFLATTLTHNPLKLA